MQNLVERLWSIGWGRETAENSFLGKNKNRKAQIEAEGERNVTMTRHFLRIIKCCVRNLMFLGFWGLFVKKSYLQVMLPQFKSDFFFFAKKNYGLVLQQRENIAQENGSFAPIARHWHCRLAWRLTRKSHKFLHIFLSDSWERHERLFTDIARMLIVRESASQEPNKWHWGIISECGRDANQMFGLVSLIVVSTY